MQTERTIKETLEQDCSHRLATFEQSLTPQDEPLLFKITFEYLKNNHLLWASRGYKYLLYIKSAHLGEIHVLLAQQLKDYQITAESKSHPTEEDFTFISAKEAVFDKNNNMLGQGAFSKVVQGLWKNKSVAIKIANATQNRIKDWLDIKREIDLHRLFSHPNIIKLYTASLEFDQFYLIEELATGKDLSHAIKTGGVKAAQVAYDIASALKYIHELGYIHGDVKPENILFNREYNRWKLGDFGTGSLKNSLHRRGTTGYLPQEIFLSPMIRNEKADVYALGMVIWQMFSKMTRPFHQSFPGPSSAERTRAVNRYIRDGHNEVIPIETSAAFRQVIEMCWAQLYRRASADELIQLLLPILELESPNTSSTLAKIPNNTPAPTMIQEPLFKKNYPIFGFLAAKKTASLIAQPTTAQSVPATPILSDIQEKRLLHL